MKYTCRIILITILILIPLGVISSQDVIPWDDEDFLYYEKGDQNFLFKGGAKLPLFIYRPYSDVQIVSDKMSVGWYGSLGWEQFISNTVAMGIELGYSANSVVSGDRLVQVPILFTTTWYPIQGPIDLPLTIKAGLVYNSLNDLGDQVYFGTMAAPTAGFLWRARPSWSFGFEASYWFVPELYFGSERRKNTAYGNLLTLSFIASFTNR